MFMSDLTQVLEIERMLFTTPWDISSFKYELEHKNTILKVAVFNEQNLPDGRRLDSLSSQVIGYVCIRTILDVTHILNLAVPPKFRRLGIGSMLLRDALEELRRSKPEARLITLEVRESNTAAIKLYEKFGFKVMGRRIGYYQKPHEDAVIMGLEI